MYYTAKIWLFLLCCLGIIQANGQVTQQKTSFDFYGHTFQYTIERGMELEVQQNPDAATIVKNSITLKSIDSRSLIDSLLVYKEKHKLNDWLYYQLIRKTAQQLCPKEANYPNYTLYKWFLLSKSGYDARLALSGHKLIFYIYNDEDISDIPFFEIGKKKYMCLNYHDYANANLNDEPPVPLPIVVPEAKNSFSYKVTRMPDFSPADYIDKKLQFTFDHRQYHFNIKLNPQVSKIFANYPGVDFETYFNIPLSAETYSSLIPLLKKNVKKMSQKRGVDYLMRFTRYAFLYENDQENFGREKRLSPEQTLFSTYSDCDDRAALFFYLVKEIYNLPMIALLYPTHITMAVEFEQPLGESIPYKGKLYAVCEATPEPEDLSIGQLASELKNVPYTIVYQYDPVK